MFTHRSLGTSCNDETSRARSKLKLLPFVTWAYFIFQIYTQFVFFFHFFNLYFHMSTMQQEIYCRWFSLIEKFKEAWSECACYKCLVTVSGMTGQAVELPADVGHGPTQPPCWVLPAHTVEVLILDTFFQRLQLRRWISISYTIIKCNWLDQSQMDATNKGVWCWAF